MGQEESTLIDPSVQPRTLSARSLEAVADYIKSGKARRIVVLTGAGISTAAGIPDFRSPDTGLYSNLARLNLPYAEAVFDIDYFKKNPDPFYVLANELYPGKFHPTVSHAFIALLAKKGLLQMLFTQNIDCLERRAGVPDEKVVEAHGSFATQRCVECKEEFPDELMKEHVFGGKVPRCEDKTCGGLVKPDIVFFGEPLPKAFGEKAPLTSMADLVLIIGTSLTVYPFAGLPEMATAGRPRVLFNMERVGQIGQRADDVLQLGSCDDGIRKLADHLGWKDELEQHWRRTVGDKEAERQLSGKITQRDALEDEVDQLADGVEAALRLENTTPEAQESSGSIISHDNPATATEAKEEPEEPLVKHKSGLESAEDLPALISKKEEEEKLSRTPASQKTDAATHEKTQDEAVKGEADKQSISSVAHTKGDGPVGGKIAS